MLGSLELISQLSRRRQLQKAYYFISSLTWRTKDNFLKYVVSPAGSVRRVSCWQRGCIIVKTVEKCEIMKKLNVKIRLLPASHQRRRSLTHGNWSSSHSSPCRWRFGFEKRNRCVKVRELCMGKSYYSTIERSVLLSAESSFIFTRLATYLSFSTWEDQFSPSYHWHLSSKQQMIKKKWKSRSLI